MSQEVLFDLAEEYTEMLNRGIRLSGESQDFFIEGRLRELSRALPDLNPRRILDFGCGLGKTAASLARIYPNAEILGIDTAENAIAFAEKTYGSSRISFRPLDGFSERRTFDLAYCNGVFHHIAPAERAGALNLVRRALKPRGFFSLFENNPWNPGTRMVMARIPFDRDAVTLTPPELVRLVRESGFDVPRSPRSLFFYPRALDFLRFSEPWLAPLPFGAQYYVLARNKETD